MAQAWFEHCIADLNAQLCFNGLCLNAGGSEAILLGTRQHLRSFLQFLVSTLLPPQSPSPIRSQPLVSLLTSILPLILMFLKSVRNLFSIFEP